MEITSKFRNIPACGIHSKKYVIKKCTVCQEFFGNFISVIKDRETCSRECTKIKKDKEYQDEHTCVCCECGESFMPSRPLEGSTTCGINCAHKYFAKWTVDTIRAEALLYTNRTDFNRECRGANVKARKLGIWDEVCSHMKSGLGSSDKDIVYIWKALGEECEGLPVYKIGVTSNRLGTNRIKVVARDAGFKYDILAMINVGLHNAIKVEGVLHRFGVKVPYTNFGGCTEFRALDTKQLSDVLGILDSFKEI